MSCYRGMSIIPCDLLKCRYFQEGQHTKLYRFLFVALYHFGPLYFIDKDNFGQSCLSINEITRCFPDYRFFQKALVERNGSVGVEKRVQQEIVS